MYTITEPDVRATVYLDFSSSSAVKVEAWIMKLPVIKLRLSDRAAVARVARVAIADVLL